MTLQKRDVVWLHSHFLYWMGGTKFIFEVAKRLKKSNRVKSLTLIVENASELAKTTYKQAGISLISLDQPTSTSAWYWLAFPFHILMDAGKVNQILKNNNLLPKSTTIISSMFPMNVVAALLPYRHVQNCYEPFAFFYDSEFISKFSMFKQLGIQLLAFLYGGLDKWATRRSDQVLTLNSVTQELMAEVFGVKSDLTQAGVDSQVFKPYVSAPILKKYAKNQVLIHSTDYTPVKGTDRVIKAMQAVAQKYPQSKLLITSTINNPLAKAKLERLATELGIANQVEFLGFLKYEELPQYYSLALGLVQGSSSSRSGTTSMALPVKEALACGTAALRPNVGAEDIIDGVTGFIVDPSDTAALSEKMMYLVADSKRAKSMGANGRQLILDRYNWEVTAKVFEKHL